MNFRYISLLCLLLAFQARSLDLSDTIAYKLNEITVTGKISKDVIPSQTLKGEELKKLNSNSIADALRYFSGIQVKDYGGVGGIKTVNIRSMGSNHAGVVYDGVELGNAQNGQIDLGQFSLENIESISLYNGQKSGILQPAKDFGFAGTIYLRTKNPTFSNRKNFNLRASFRTGSFDLINPSLLLEYRISNKLNVSLNAEWLKSSGRYKFRYRRVTPMGEVAYDTTAVRQNGDINALRVELNINGLLTSGSWNVKFYKYNSQRGIPGAIVNNVWRRGERIWDNNMFFQGRYTVSAGRYNTLNLIKFSFYRTHYVNKDDRQMAIDNIYRQKEIYFSSSNMYEILYWWQISLSYDFLWNKLEADIFNFPEPLRFTNYLSAATSIELDRFKAQISALGTFVSDKTKNTHGFSNRSVFSPSIYMSGNPFATHDFSLRAFIKQSFRMPTFNDLYYTEIGNADLKPERVTQYNIGLLYQKSFSQLVRSVRGNGDIYYNRIKDKIIAYPKGQQFRWTMLNLGLVDITGIELSTLITLSPFKAFFITLRGQYTFQRAIDVTSKSDSYYGHQIPYIPRHSGSVVVNADWKGWGLNYSWIYVGERYNQQENIIYNYTQPWYTSDISLSKDLQIRNIGLRLLLEVNNLFSQDYDVIINYPMPKRNYRFTISFSI